MVIWTLLDTHGSAVVYSYNLLVAGAGKSARFGYRVRTSELSRQARSCRRTTKPTKERVDARHFQGAAIAAG